jgi:hypothetical protein
MCLDVFGQTAPSIPLRGMSKVRQVSRVNLGFRFVRIQTPLCLSHQHLGSFSSTHQQTMQHHSLSIGTSLLTRATSLRAGSIRSIVCAVANELPRCAPLETFPLSQMSPECRKRGLAFLEHSNRCLRLYQPPPAHSNGGLWFCWLDHHFFSRTSTACSRHECLILQYRYWTAL